MTKYYPGKRREATLWMLMSVPPIIGLPCFMLIDLMMPFGTSTASTPDKFCAAVAGFVWVLFFVKLGKIRGITTSIEAETINITYYSGKKTSLDIVRTDNVYIDHKMNLLSIGPLEIDVPLPFSQTCRLIVENTKMYLNMDNIKDPHSEAIGIVEMMRNKKS